MAMVMAKAVATVAGSEFLGVHWKHQGSSSIVYKVWFILVVLSFGNAQAPDGQAQPSTPEKSLPVSSPFPLTPAFFIYGDSTVDVGNNNYLVTLAKANMEPYGKDFDTHTPTGRFCNGRLSIDYLASYMGLPFSAPFLSGLNVTSMQQGANFASAGAGVFDESGNDLGEHVPLDEQVNQLGRFKEKLEAVQGHDAAEYLLSRSIHYVSIGSNDFIHYYLRNVSAVESHYTPAQFGELMIGTLMFNLKNLYRIGARKIVVLGIGPLGCAPHFLFEDGSNTGSCINEINVMIQDYNDWLRAKVADLYASHADLVITFCDAYEALHPIVRKPNEYGFKTASTACCGMGRFGGFLMCMSPQMACENATSHVWWDEFHPTDKANEFLAISIWSGQICHEMSLQELVNTVPDYQYCVTNPTSPLCVWNNED